MACAISTLRQFGFTNAMRGGDPANHGDAEAVVPAVVQQPPAAGLWLIPSALLGR